jgi:hypothetical protein
MRGEERRGAAGDKPTEPKKKQRRAEETRQATGDHLND